MKTAFLTTICLLCFQTAAIRAQEVIITDFPPGIAESADPGIVKPYAAALRGIADSLQKYPMARVVVIGGADGGRYNKNHDAKNPGIALGRAQFLRNILIDEFQIDSTRILLQTKYSPEIGASHRFVSVRLEKEPASRQDDLLTGQEPAKVVVIKDTIIQIHDDTSEPSGLQVGVGGASSPYGGMPVAVGAIVWKRQVYVEGIFGHTIWNETTLHRGVNLDIRHRMAGGAILYFPFENVPVGLYGGWVRVEEISQKFYSYVRMSEGPLFGLRVMPYHYLSVTGAYNPTKERLAGNAAASPYTDQFFLSVTIHTLLGGGR